MEKLLQYWSKNLDDTMTVLIGSCRKKVVAAVGVEQFKCYAETHQLEIHN